MMNKNGQNVVEYILLVVAVLTVLIIFLGQGNKYHQAIEKTMFKGAVDQVSSLANQIQVLP